MKVLLSIGNISNSNNRSTNWATNKGTQCNLLIAPPLDKFSAVGLETSFVTEPDQEDTDFCYSQEDTTTE